MSRITCSACGGKKGTTAEDRCHVCDGKGYELGGEVEVAIDPSTVWKIRIVCRCSEAFIFSIPDEVMHLVTRKLCPKCHGAFLHEGGVIIRAEDGTELKKTVSDGPLKPTGDEEYIM